MIGHGGKMQELYQERILELARASKHSKPIDNPTHRAEKNNAICGDKVIINATITDNMVYDAHLIVRGCALCEAGAGIWKETAVGKGLNELNLLRDELDNFLKNTLVEFIQETNSSYAKSILEDFKNSVKKFILVKPKSVKLDKVLDNKSAAA